MNDIMVTMLFINTPKTKTNTIKSFIANSESDLLFFSNHLQIKPLHIRYNGCLYSIQLVECILWGKAVASYIRLESSGKFTDTLLSSKLSVLLADGDCDIINLKRYGG